MIIMMFTKTDWIFFSRDHLAFTRRWSQSKTAQRRSSRLYAYPGEKCIRTFVNHPSTNLYSTTFYYGRAVVSKVGQRVLLVETAQRRGEGFESNDFCLPSSFSFSFTTFISRQDGLRVLAVVREDRRGDFSAGLLLQHIASHCFVCKTPNCTIRIDMILHSIYPVSLRLTPTHNYV